MTNPVRGPMAGKKNRLVLITGAGSGIGRATAVRFGNRGDTVLVTDIDEPAAKATAAQIVDAGRSSYSYPQDVTDVDSWKLLSDKIIERYGVPDVLVNNAGILISGGFLEQSTQDWDRMMAVNLSGVYYGSRIVGEAMAARGEGGHIVNIASAGAWLPNRVAASYCVAKAGVLMLSESMRIDLSHHGIGVSAICPGVIRTNLAAHSTRAGLSKDDELEFTADLADAQDRFSYAGPHVVARAVERAVTYNLGVVPVNPEAYVLWGARRIAPGLTRYLVGFGGMDLADRAIDLVERIVPKQFSLRKVSDG